ncbi:MAG TPA: S-adenosylmethionine decarboxylase [Rhodopirellula baltica]|uniref:Probable S-adenosylmethionine decarboxylase proenzyme n=1 Tax=Rhodopirellula baltica (strain DSM 10527 / NCIMB 13988 / SH1) TaxID=243090 RepID=Q7UUL7_RHOBA|nr:S-adenosylmethionine decarboxylase [Rhodopirellula baltica]CAD73062.1 probable S-adenosylmethionine decarboxylase proenzyme [Rhodopirellula baltica SH 1]HBE61723.1 S-adenosylmethionine decarboxylase [Rhodopirellula baltica]
MPATPVNATTNKTSDSSTAAPSISVGGQWIVDASGCDPKTLQSLATIQSICQDVIASLGLKVVGEPQSHVFGPPHGVTALYLLSESHLAVHTYPEHGVATFNLVCCRETAVWDWQTQLQSRLNATNVRVRHLRRGAWETNEASDTHCCNASSTHIPEAITEVDE